MNRLIFILSATLVAIGATTMAQDSPVKITIKAVEGLQFSPVRFGVQAGQTVELKVENHDPNDQPHNFVLIKPGSLSEIQVASMQITPEAIENGYVPNNENVIFASKLLNPDGKDAISFKAPEKKGIYPYVCTFPGHALVMYGALYVDEKIKGKLAYDENIPEIARQADMEVLKESLKVERPTFQRMFIENAGPAAIGVALPHDQNVCWDAGNCRLRFAWTGDFIDPIRYYNGNGSQWATILGEEYWNAGGGEDTRGLQIGDGAGELSFKGYQLEGGVPVFEYTIDDVGVRETITSDESGLGWRFRIQSPGGEVRVLAPDSDAVSISGKAGKRDGDYWIVPADQAADFTLRISQK